MSLILCLSHAPNEAAGRSELENIKETWGKPCKPERGKKMDAEAAELGPGPEPSDCPVWRTTYR